MGCGRLFAISKNRYPNNPCTCGDRDSLFKGSSCPTEKTVKAKSSFGQGFRTGETVVIAVAQLTIDVRIPPRLMCKCYSSCLTCTL